MKNTVFKRFVRRKTSLVGGIVLILILLMALVGPFLCRYSPFTVDLNAIYAPVSFAHPLGTDYLGRDLLTRIIFGARTTLLVSFAGVMAGSLLGIVLGVMSGYFGGIIDEIFSRLTDILLAFPSLLLAIAIVSVIGIGTKATIIAIGFSSIPTVGRMVRSMVVTIKNTEYIQACRVMGIPSLQVVMTHVVPNSMSQIIVNTTLNLGTGILSASSLSFLGLGVQPPNPEWGSMLSQAIETLRLYPIGCFAPGLAITLTVLSFSLVGDGLRDALDPKLKNR